ncbi:MAG: hypothetical protein JKY31_13020 [Rhodobacteraceae bacterium]|nr:hypothetical protein [Paracoccaceae bacterium]
MAAGNWTAEWKILKKNFEAKTGKKKPKASVTNIIGQSNLSPTLKKCDDAYNKCESAKSTKKKISALKDLISNAAKFAKLSDSYCLDVKKAIVSAGKDMVLMNELDILRKKLQSVKATMASKIRSQDAAIKKLNIWEKMARDMRIDLTGALKRGALFAAKVKSSPTHDVWNSGIQTAARDITQQIGNVEKIRAKDYDIPGIPQKNAGAIFRKMTPWASGDVIFQKDTLPATILSERMDYLKTIQATAKWMDS